MTVGDRRSGVWTQAVHDYLTGSVSSRFRGQEATVSDHWQGRDNLLWRARCGDGADVVVKMFIDAGQARCRRQFNGQAQFAAAGLAPEPLWYDRYPHGLPCQILVYTWAEGEALQLTDLQHCIAHADAMARIHSAERDEAQRFSPHPFNLLTFWQIWQASEAPLREWISAAAAPLLVECVAMLWAAVHREMEAALPLLGETAPAPVHGDPAAENSLFRGGLGLLVDWEYFGLGDPAQEVARFLFYEDGGWPDEDKAKWREHYEHAHPAPGFTERVDLYFRLLNFQAVTYLLDGIRQRTEPEVSETDSEAIRTQYRAFLAETLAVALGRSLALWELPPLGIAENRLLADEIGNLMNIQAPGRNTSAASAN